MRLVWSWCTRGTDGGFAQKQLISDRLASPSASPTPTRLLKRSRRDVRWNKILINSLYRVFLKSPVMVFLGICRSGGFFRHYKWLNKCILPMVPLTDNIVFGRKIAFLREMAAAVGSSLPWTRRKLATFSTSDSSKSSQQRRGTVKVTPKLRSPRPSPSGKCGGKCGGSLLPHQRGHPKAKTFKKNGGFWRRIAAPDPSNRANIPELKVSWYAEKKKKTFFDGKHQIMFSTTEVLIHPKQSRSSVLVDESSLYMRRDPAHGPIGRQKTRRYFFSSPEMHHVVSEPVCALTRHLMGSRKKREGTSARTLYVFVCLIVIMLSESSEIMKSSGPIGLKM